MRTSETTQIIQTQLNNAYQIWQNTKQQRDNILKERRVLESELETDDRTI